MGVTGLWSIVQPCARPIKLDTLNRKRLAVDASIWIYQFLKAVRDKEGNALRNSHVVGFFRRICKLLFVGIKPVFVFDGGAPTLKRQTVLNRKRRREGRREDASRTAGRLLAVQMQRRAEEEEQKRKDQQHEEDEAVPDDNLVYVDELQMTQQERQQNRKFRKKDAYHLPDLDVSMNEMGGPNDPRIMSLEELEAYARQFDTGEDINLYDFSKIDFDSPFFTSLPASDRYNILNAARLRSRLRMGHSKEQLDSMFPDRMAFSRFQIDRVRERNELTQRLMNLNGFGGGSDMDSLDKPGRVAGEKGREYVLVKNDGVEGGWALGVISDEGTKRDKPIDIDKPVLPALREDSESEGDGFEDVPIEGLNRLLKRRNLESDDNDALAKRRRTLYESKQRGTRRKPRDLTRQDDPTSLFIADDAIGEVRDDETWEDGDANGELFDMGGEPEEDEELSRAIALSLEKDQSSSKANDSVEQTVDAEESDDVRGDIHQSAVEDAMPVPAGSARAIANVLNMRAFKTAPDSHETTSFGVPLPKSRENTLPEAEDADEDAEDDVDLQAALAESRLRKQKAPVSARQATSLKSGHSVDTAAKNAGFSGPLPFEKLDLGASLLGKKKMQQCSEEAAGGFENLELAEKHTENQRKAEPLPPWFFGDLEDDIEKQRAIETEDRERAKEFSRQFRFQSREEPTLMGHETGEVIDLEAEEQQKPFQEGEVIDLDVEENQQSNGDKVASMADMAEVSKLEPHFSNEGDQREAYRLPRRADPFRVNSDEEKEDVGVPPTPASAPMHPVTQRDANREDEGIEWSESEDEVTACAQKPFESARGSTQKQTSRSPSMEFEDAMPRKEDVLGTSNRSRVAARPTLTESLNTHGSVQHVESHSELDDEAIVDEDDSAPAPVSGIVHQDSVPDDDFDDFSDPEEEELLKALTLEAEEHARFASTLNNRTTAQNIADYDRELKQLRNQQKKDRRDADEVTHIMITECQQLLRLFGLPYITAPMEAEAQCAELVKLGLVDGIVTDDSDCFLFGGTRVYKNMFNQAKFVECYLASDLEKEFDLTREKMIQVAHLLGSDYTEGLSGVGPVTALEILGDFQTLEEFKAWFLGVQMGTVNTDDDKGHVFRKKFRKQATKIVLPTAFPDPRVDIAYISPEVDKDPQPFQWGVPDLDALRSFLMATIGWSQERTDEVLVPVIRDMNRRIDEGTQSNITAFFEGGVGIGAAGAQPTVAGDAFAPRKRVDGSKRMGTALGRMADRAKLKRAASTYVSGDGQQLNGDVAGDTTSTDSTRVTKKRAAKKRVANEAALNGAEEDDNECEAPQRKFKRRPV